MCRGAVKELVGGGSAGMEATVGAMFGGGCEGVCGRELCRFGDYYVGKGSADMEATMCVGAL